MYQFTATMSQTARGIAAAACAAVVATALSFGLTVTPATAYAADEQEATSLYAASTELYTQGSLGVNKPAAIDKTVKKNAKAIVKAAKATKGTDLEKLAKIYTYLATDKKDGGVFTYGDYLSDFYFAATDAADKAFYPATQPKEMSGYYKKYAVDGFKTKKATCYHYASLFAVAAKQALGDAATVRIAVGGTNGTGSWNPHHSWVEVTLGKTTYVYDLTNGRYYAANTAKSATDFGPFAGSKKAKVKAYYKKYKSAQYCAVTL